MHNYNSTLALIIASEATSETEISVTDSQARVKAEASEAKNHESSFTSQASLENLVVANG